MNHDLAAKIMMTGNSSGQDSRIAAIENATILARAQISDDWEIQVRHSDELDGHHIYFYNTDSRSYSHYSEITLWSCYYKNGEFMFAYCSYTNFTNIIGDYYKTDYGEIYKSYDRIATISEVTGSTLKNRYSDYRNSGYYLTLDVSMREVAHYYDTDGSVKSQSESTLTNRWSTDYIEYTSMGLWSDLAVLRSDYQTYLNDVLDFGLLS